MASPLSHCPACGYALTGLPDIHHCPECGLAYDRRWVVMGGLPQSRGRSGRVILIRVGMMWLIAASASFLVSLPTLFWTATAVLCIAFLYVLVARRKNYWTAVGPEGVCVYSGSRVLQEVSWSAVAVARISQDGNIELIARDGQTRGLRHAALALWRRADWQRIVDAINTYPYKDT